MDRRRFLSAASTCFATTAFSAIAHDSLASEELLETSSNPIPLLQGMTNAHESVFVALIKKEISYSYQVKDCDGVQCSHKVIAHEERDHSEFAIEKILVSGLFPNRKYFFEVIENSTGKLLDQRTFQSLDLSSERGRFVITSCMFDLIDLGGDIIWKSLVKSNPQLVFMIGDQVYADFGADESEAGLWDRYCQVRSRLWIFKSRQLIPMLTTWDDHDYGCNNGTKDFRLKESITSIFRSFWGNEPLEGLYPGPGISSLFTAWGQKFFLMDDRSFRDEKNSGGRHWGLNQEDFLFSQLSKSREPAWLMNGSQYFGGYLRRESFEGDHRENLRQVLSQLSKIEAPVNFVSGDVHFSEVMKIEKELLGYQTFEYTASSIHSLTWPFNHLQKGKNPRRVTASPIHNFMLFTAHSNSNEGWSISAECLNRWGNSKFQHETKILRGS